MDALTPLVGEGAEHERHQREAPRARHHGQSAATSHRRPEMVPALRVPGEGLDEVVSQGPVGVDEADRCGIRIAGVGAAPG
jgi:hypothetical protein